MLETDTYTSPCGDRCCSVIDSSYQGCAPNNTFDGPAVLPSIFRFDDYIYFHPISFLPPTITYRASGILVWSHARKLWVGTGSASDSFGTTSWTFLLKCVNCGFGFSFLIRTEYIHNSVPGVDDYCDGSNIVNQAPLYVSAFRSFPFSGNTANERVQVYV